jgi:hypothetical protein
MNPKINRLSQICEFAGRTQRIAPVETFFSIGGRGYYENPASDLLAYFINKGHHGLEDAFLGAILDSIPGNCEDSVQSMLRQSIKVEREMRTNKGNRMDLLISADHWVLVIENKVRHWLANPLVDYEETTNAISGDRKVYRMILSPSGESPDPNNWIPLRYHDLTRRIRRRLDSTTSPEGTEKWRVIAEDFLLHIEQEIAKIPMNKDDIEFVENHLKELQEIQRMRNEYMHHLWGLIHSELRCTENSKLEIHWKSKYFLVKADNWKQWEIGLTAPNHQDLDDVGLLTVRIWGPKESPMLDMWHRQYFSDYAEAGEIGPYKEYCRYFDQSQEALAELKRLHQILLNPTTRIFDSSASCADNP